MKCMYYQGQMERKTAPFNIERQGYHIAWDAIPAWVCDQCGEVYFEDKEVGAVDAMKGKLDGVNVEVHWLKEHDYVMMLMTSYGTYEKVGEDKKRIYEKNWKKENWSSIQI